MKKTGRMNEMNHPKLDKLLSDAFSGGERLCRELRLSDEDARLLSLCYPATVTPMGEQWYHITISSAQN